MRTKRRRRNRQTQTNRQPATDASRYSGPVRASQESLATIEIAFDFPATSSSSGTVADVFNDYPTNSPDWPNLSATFSEYRVLAMTVKFTPSAEGATIASLSYAPLYIVWDASGASAALTSYTQCGNYVLQKVRAINQPIVISHRMNGQEEATFVATSNPLVDYNFKTFSTGLTASTTYGRYFVMLLCQFRGRQ